MKKRILKIVLFVPAAIATIFMLPYMVVYYGSTGEILKSPIKMLVNF